MWRDVCVANRESLMVELRGYRALLDELQGALEVANGDAIESVFSAAAECRRTHAPRLDAE